MERIGSQKCLVTGATGGIGVPLVRELLDRGHTVRVLVRDGTPAERFGKSVEIVRGTLPDQAAINMAVEGVDWVFHLAAKLHVNEPRPEDRDEYVAVNVEGTRSLLDAAERTGVQKFVFFSTINVYGSSGNGMVFNEESALNPIGIYGETKRLGEQMVLAARGVNGDKIGVVLRVAAVYGPRMKGNYVRLAEAIQKRRFFFVGDGQNRRTVAHQADVVEAAVLAAERAEGGSIYNVTDGSIHTLKEIAAAVSSAMRMRSPRLKVPVAPVRFGIAMIEGLARTLGIDPPVSRHLLAKFLEDVAVDGSRIQRELGFRPRFDLHSGWRDALAAKKGNGNF